MEQRLVVTERDLCELAKLANPTSTELVYIIKDLETLEGTVFFERNKQERTVSHVAKVKS